VVATQNWERKSGNPPPPTPPFDTEVVKGERGDLKELSKKEGLVGGKAKKGVPRKSSPSERMSGG